MLAAGMGWRAVEPVEKLLITALLNQPIRAILGSDQQRRPSVDNSFHTDDV